jgi:hypothetical protein
MFLDWHQDSATFRVLALSIDSTMSRCILLECIPWLLNIEVSQTMPFPTGKFHTSENRRSATSNRSMLKAGVFMILAMFQVTAMAEIDCHAFFGDGFETLEEPAISRLRCTDAPPFSLITIGASFDPADGDLDVSMVDEFGECIAGRLGDECNWANREFETGEEILSAVNVEDDSVRTVYWRISSASDVVPPFVTVESVQPFLDGPVCADLFTADDCMGQPGGVPSPMQFPVTYPNDPYVGDGLRPQTPANYRWARRELLMLVRYAMHETQIRHAGTKALGVGDISERNGAIPGTDNGLPRHPAGTHMQGTDVDIAYFHTLAAGGQAPFNDIRAICDANGGSHDELSCDPSAASTHIVDLPRQVSFLAKLLVSDRIRVVGVDEVIGPLLLAEADAQFEVNQITEAEHNAFGTKLAFNPAAGWVRLFQYMHVSFNSGAL